MALPKNKKRKYKDKEKRHVVRCITINQTVDKFLSTVIASRFITTLVENSLEYKEFLLNVESDSLDSD